MKAIKFYYENWNSGECGHTTLVIPEMTESEKMRFTYEDVIIYEFRHLIGSNNFKIEIEFIKDCEIKE